MMSWMCFFYFLKCFLILGLYCYIIKKGGDVNKLKVKINEYLFLIVYILYNRKNLVLFFYFIIFEVDNEIFKC